MYCANGWGKTMSEVQEEAQETRLKAYVDEAGPRSFHRNLVPQDDGNFSLIVAVSFDLDEHDEAVRRLQPEFDKFVAAAPPGAKLHITDAFKPGNEAWGKVATEVRQRYYEIMMELRPVVIYGARRFRLARAEHDSMSQLKASGFAAKRWSVSIVGANRPSEERVEDDAFTSLILRIDEFGTMAADHYSNPKVDLLFDETNKSEADRFDAIIRSTETLSKTVETVKGFDTARKKRVEGTISISVGKGDEFQIDITHLGSITVVGKNHPLVFAADIVANSLNRHLLSLAPNAPLHAPSSIERWVLAQLVCCLKDSVLDDIN